MAVPTTPAIASYTQPTATHQASRDTVEILANGNVVVNVLRLDASGKGMETVQLTVPAAGGAVIDSLGRSYGNVAAGSALLTAVESILTQIDNAIAAQAAAGKYSR
jgi:hypothetical protein